MTSSCLTMSSQNVKFIRVFLTASIVLVYLTNESFEGHIPFQFHVLLVEPSEFDMWPSMEPDELQCGDNMTPVRIEEIDETFCDCLQGYLYYEKTEMCYLPYSSAPCDEGKHLVVPANQREAECVENPCDSDKVPYKGSCYTLMESCGSNGTLVISEETYEPICSSSLGVRVGVVNFPLKPCSSGTRRSGIDPQCYIVFDDPIGIRKP